MKTVVISCSPKKKFAASAYFARLQCAFLRGQKVRKNLRAKSDYAEIRDELADASAVVFCMPLYVDGIPSHVLPFLKEMETFCRDRSLQLQVYVISNNGFIEGNQNSVVMEIMENFCVRSNLAFGGGLGVGGGVMLNVMRIVSLVQLGMFFLTTVLYGIQSGKWFSPYMTMGFLISIAVIVFLQSGLFWHVLRMGCAIQRKDFYGKKYTRILLPSFLFILFADLFFLIVSLIQGGIFRGWLKKK